MVVQTNVVIGKLLEKNEWEFYAENDNIAIRHVFPHFLSPISLTLQVIMKMRAFRAEVLMICKYQENLNRFAANRKIAPLQQGRPICQLV